MKKYTFILGLCIAFSSFGQERIEVSFDKAVFLIFPNEVHRWSCGAKEYVGVLHTENKIVLQAKEEYFEETNLVIELIDGTFFAFDLVYNNAPKSYFHPIRYDKSIYNPSGESASQNSASQPNDATKVSAATSPPIASLTPAQRMQKDKTAKGVPQIIIDRAEKAMKESDFITRIGSIEFKMMLYVSGIWIVDNVFYFKVNIKNMANVPYDVDYSQFIIKSHKSGLKGQSAMAEGLTPIYIHNYDKKQIQANEIVTYIFVMDKFTIADKKMLWLEVWEGGNGDRSLKVSVESNEILKAKNKL
jgi:hypothetical protein